MNRQSRVVLRVYERDFESEEGGGKSYRVRTFGIRKRLDQILIGSIVKHHFEGTADEGDILYALWQATSEEDWEDFAAKPKGEWTKLQRSAYDVVWESWATGSPLTHSDISDRMLNFVSGYEEGYKQAQEDWGLPVKSALYPAEER